MLDQRTSSNHKHDRGQTSGLKSVKTLKVTFYPVRITRKYTFLVWADTGTNEGKGNI